MSYPYNSELTVSNQFGQIDFSNPNIMPMLKMIVKQQQWATRAYLPPEHMTCRKETIIGDDGESIDCFVLEPDGVTEPLPAMLYCHGGAFLLPVQISALQIASTFVQQLPMRIFIPEYRLLPEFPAPSAFLDCLGVWKYMVASSEKLRILPGKMLLYGESAGGCIAAGIAQFIRDKEAHQACGQMLIYPLTDTCDAPRESFIKYSDTAWSLRSIQFIWREYLKNGTAGLAKYLIPMQNSSFQHLPPAYIEPQEIDSLKDEGIEYAAKLKDAGVPVMCNVIAGSYHGFDAEQESPFVQRVLKERVQVMKLLCGRNYGSWNRG